MKAKELILLYPQYSDRIGYGHLKRCELLSRILQSRYRTLVLKKTDFPQILSLVKSRKVKLLILDRRFYTARMVRELSRHCDLALMDAQRLFPALRKIIYINPTTPLTYCFLSPNQFHYQGIPWMPLDPVLIRLTKRKKETRDGLAVSFGNSDPNGLSLRVLKYLKRAGYDGNVTLIIGPHFCKKAVQRLKEYLTSSFSRYRILENRQNILPVLAKSGYLISSFSLTALEAALLSCRVALFNNSPYHSRLADAHGFFYNLGTFRRTPPFLIPDRIIKFISGSSLPQVPPVFNSNNRLRRILKGHEEPVVPEKCPVCLNHGVSLVLNQAEKQIWSCPFCRSRFLRIKTAGKQISAYTADYFKDEYKSRYGRTYLQDRKNIMELSGARLKIIQALLKKQIRGKRILDAGCAYGFFLEKARELGFIPSGIEAEKEAAHYARIHSGLDVRQGDFLKSELKERFHVITFWYVFEHFPDPEGVLNKILPLLEEGALLCFSIPNGNGPFYRYNRSEWLDRHPDDHYFDYSAKGFEILMGRYGFRLMKKRTTGFHPERYRNFPRFLHPLLRISGQGDTMELYFQKRRP